MKKTLLFFMLMFAMSITAQNREEKSGIQWLRRSTTSQQTLKQQKRSKQPLAANELSQFVPNQSALQQKLQANKKAPLSEDPIAQRPIKKVKTTAISWRDIGTLTSPWAETINFDPANEALIPFQFVDEYGYTTNLLCYAVKFTLAQDELISASSSNFNDFTLYADPEAQQEVLWGYNLLQPVKAGTYYLLISDCGMLQWEWSEPFQASIELQTVSATSILLPSQQSVSITQDNSLLLADTYYAVFYKFTLSQDGVVNFGSSFDENAMGEHMSYFELDLLTDKYLINVSDSDIPLKAGDYYIVAYAIMWDDNAFWQGHTSVEAQLDIKTKTLAAPVALSVPSEQDFSLTENNVYHFFDYYSVLYTLHLDEDQMIEIIDADNQWAKVIYDKETWANIDGFYPQESAIVQLSAGDYYLALADYNRLYDGETPLNGHLSIRIPQSYATLDFSEEIAIGETKIGDDASLLSVITDIDPYSGIEMEKVAAYHFKAQEGHIYKLTMECYVKASYMQPTLALFHAPNTGDIYADNIRGAMPYINASSGTGSLTWISDVDGDVNVMFFFESPDSNVMFKLTLEEIQATHTDTQGTTPAYEDITLPFVSYLHFDPAYNAYWDNNASEYYKLYKLTLSEKTLLKVEAGFNVEQGSNIYLKVFTDADRTQQLGDSWGFGETNSLLLDAGDYYLALTDYGYSNYNDDYAECLVELGGSSDFMEIPTITVAQLMDDPAIAVVNYANDLSYTDQGYFVYGTSKLVTEPSIYIFELFAKGYKLTGMSANDVVHIVDRQPNYETESRLGIYQKESDGSYTQLTYNTIDWDFSGITHIEFTAPETRDYYIMASSYNSYPAVYNNVEYPSYQVAIWTGTAGDEPVAGNLQLPAEITIASTAANATEVNLGADASSADLKLALLALEITGTTQTGVTVALGNNPLSWEVNNLATEASFVSIPAPYMAAENYVPATVQITVETGINDIASEAIRIVKSGNGLVTVAGLQGKEVISLIDINGRIWSKTAVKGATATIETSVLPKGVYIVAVQNSKKLAVLKFVK